jgi:SAM-dependent methyltransferase
VTGSAPDRAAEQAAYWNGPGGARWVQRQPQQDALLEPAQRILLAHAAAQPGESVLDIGCGGGATAVALARQVQPGGHVLGVDLSAPLLEHARRSRPAGLALEYALADAARYAFAAGGADLLCSRFGLMFFADPLRAFTHLRGALRPGGRVVFACWRGPRENPWLLLPLQAAVRHVPRLPEQAPEDPGPFAFADRARVHALLAGAGFEAIRIEGHEVLLDLADGQGLDAAVDTAIGIGPASRALQDQPAGLQAAARAAIRAALAAVQEGARVPLPGALWIVQARNPGAAGSKDEDSP